MKISITPLEDIQDSLIIIQDFSQKEYPDDVNCVVERAMKLEGYLALSSKLMADSKWHYNNIFESGFIDAIKTTSKYQASTTNLYLKALCKDYQYLVDMSDRLNSTLTHQLDFARTLISKYKAEMQNRL